MRIAMLGQKGIPASIGGIEKHVEELSTRLVKAGLSVIVYARPWFTANKAHTTIPGLTVINLPSIRTKHLDTITHTFLATLHAMKHADILHYHGVGPALLAWIPRLFTPHKKVVVTFHCIDRKHSKWGFIAKSILRLGEYFSCQFAHEIIAVSPTIHLYIRDVYDRESLLIPSGVPDYTKTDTNKALKKFDLEPKKYILAVSRFVEHKGLHYLIEAWKKLRTKNAQLFGDMKLVIVGAGHHTEKYERDLKASVKQEDAIIFTGVQSGTDLAELFSHATLLVHPSNNEGLPITLLEAMSYQLPVIVSDIVEHRDLVPNPNFRFAKSNTQNLAEKIEKFLLLSAEEKNEIAEENKKFVTKNYSWGRVVEEIIQCYGSEITRDVTVPKLKQANM